VLIAFEGLATAVASEREDAAGRLATAGALTVERLDDAATARALDAAREVRRLVPAVVAVATAGVLPAAVGTYLEAADALATAAGVRLAAAAQAGHGVVTLILAAAEASAPPPAVATASVLARCRDAARAGGGHLAVDWAPLGVRELCPVWDSPGPATALMRQLKARLDPAGVLNPGRFVAGI
jgi:FAD/FMN-containing dehydrogenase